MWQVRILKSKNKVRQNQDCTLYSCSPFRGALRYHQCWPWGVSPSREEVCSGWWTFRFFHWRGGFSEIRHPNNGISGKVSVEHASYQVKTDRCPAVQGWWPISLPHFAWREDGRKFDAYNHCIHATALCPRLEHNGYVHQFWWCFR